MFITAAKTAIVEGLNAAFEALGPITDNYTKDLTPRSVTIEYPVDEIQWPAIFVQFRPVTVQWTGLGPDQYQAILDNSENPIGYEGIRQGYYEGYFDLQILALHSEERDRLWDSLYNLILMNPGSVASSALYQSLADDNLIAMTIQQGTVSTLGDTVSPGTPFSPEELTYEASIRFQCIGEFYENKYNQQLLPISDITLEGTITDPPPGSGMWNEL